MPRPMKDGLGPPAIARLVSALSKVHSNLDSVALTEEIHTGLESLELKDRVRHVIRRLHDHFPEFEQAAAILRGLPAVWDAGDPDDNLRGFAAWPLIDYVGEYGLDHFDVALDTLRQLTGLFTAEFAIRPFLLQDVQRTLSTVSTWVHDPDDAVRRLATEGTRPLLPWGVQIPALRQDPGLCRHILETLRDDPSESVRRSVANHLNDHAKSHPEWVVDLCQEWHDNADANRQRLIRHALRTLVKSGNARVFPLLGYTPLPQVDLRDTRIDTPHVVLGSSLEFSTTLVSMARVPQQFVLDFAILHRKKNGGHLAKVFKWCTPKLQPGESMVVQKSHPMRRVTTRTYYGGTQGLMLLVNGKASAEFEFHLEVTDSRDRKRAPSGDAKNGDAKNGDAKNGDTKSGDTKAR